MHKTDGVIPALVIFSLLALVTWFRVAPLVVADEIGYLGLAQYIATGDGPNMGFSAYLYFGYSLFLAPLFLVFTDTEIIYRGAILINCAFLALCVPVFLAISDEMGIKRDWKTVAIVGLVLLWPKTIYQANFAWAEALFQLLFLLSVLLAGKVARKNTAILNAVFALLIIALYAIHGRAIGILPIGVVLLTAIAIFKRSWTPLPAIAAIFIGYIAVKHLNAYYSSALWEVQSSMGAIISGRLASVMSLQGIKKLVMLAAGQAWYQTVSTLGFAVLGIIGILHWSWARRDSASVMLLFGLGSVGIVFVASVGQMLVAYRLDHLVYGRYVDATSVFLLWFGLTWANQIERKSIPNLLAMSGVFAAILSFIILRYLKFYIPQITDSEVRWTLNIPAISLPYDMAMPLAGNGIAALLWGVTGAVAVVILCMCALFVGKYRSATLIGALVVLSVAVDYHLYTGLVRQTAGQRVVLANGKKAFAKAKDSLFWDKSAIESGYVFLSQFATQSGHIPLIDLTKSDLPTGAYAIIGPSAMVNGLTCVAKLGGTAKIVTSLDVAPSC